MKFYVYKITNKVNGKIYIGKTGDATRRWKKHLTVAKSPTQNNHRLIHKAIRKYGENNFSFEIIESVDLESEALEKEMRWIAYYQSNTARYGKDAGYNQTDGGEGTSGHKHSEESIKQMSESHIGMHAGAKNPMYGKPRTEEVKAAISKSRAEKFDLYSEINRGSNNPNAKLNEEKVALINQLIINGKTDTEIAKLFSVSRKLISGIRRGTHWKHIQLATQTLSVPGL